MSKQRIFGVAALAAVTGAGASIASAIVTIPTVPIGNPGNAPDSLTGNLYGSVPYRYNIGTYEITNEQYAAFLNAVAQTDTNGLYNANMAGSFGGITRSGASGSYIYAVLSGRGNNPVNYVSFWDACRFANWLHNGQTTGVQDASTTEDGAYTLTATGIANNTVTRNAGARWAVTSENEWYKAAYHQPAAQGGDSDSYWLFATSSNTLTTAQANYDNPFGNFTAVGSYPANFYGTFDMTGNAHELSESIGTVGSLSIYRSARGGAFESPNPSTHLDSGVRADVRAFLFPSTEDYSLGFRVSQVFPTSTTISTVPVGNPGNAADTRPMLDGTSGFGRVDYDYNIGTYEVTAGQYTAFLNAVAATDTNNLYSVNQGLVSALGCGITRSGTSGNYTYSVDPNFVDRPVNWVSFWAAARFANWLHNGQPSGAQDATTTEDGAYLLTPGAIGANTVVRKPGWRWAIPTEDEWYKAAYYKGGGTNAGYWQFATRSDALPGRDLADVSGNNSNYYNGTGAYPLQSPYYFTVVGAFHNSTSAYGTFDQGGNVREWNEAAFGADRGDRGGQYCCSGNYMRFDDRFHTGPALVSPASGFRVVQAVVPSPCDRADIDDDGSVTVTDLFGFLDAWFAQFGQSGSGLAADFDGNGSVAVSDLFGYLDAWFEYFGTAC